MDHFSRLQFDDEEGKQRAEEEISDLQEIAGPHLSSMIAQECRPILSSRSRDAHLPHVFLDRSLTHAHTQLEQLTADAFGSEDAGYSWPLS
jgi:hypothetical protein